MSIKIHDENNVPKLLKMLEELANTHLEVGVFGEDDSDMVKIAAVHEFGATIKFKTREGTVTIPERSYIRSGYETNKDDIMSKGDLLLGEVLELKLPVSTFFETMGEYIVGLIQEYMTDLKEPPNAKSTIKQKGSSNPLIDEGRLRDSITYKVVKG